MSLLALAGCREPVDTHVPEQGPPPVSGGGLEIVAGGAYAIASDPARASIHIVNLEQGSDRRIQLTAADEPGRIVEGPDGVVHVVLRSAGEVLSIDPATGTQIRRREACEGPRGIDVDPDTGDLLVACTEGIVVRMPGGEGGVMSRFPLAPDLRDIVVYSGGRMLVSRFRSAEVLMVEDERIVHTEVLPRFDDALGRSLASTVAWRMRETAGGDVMVMHQHSVTSQLGSLGSTTGGVYYGGDCDVGVVRPAVSRVSPRWGDAPNATVGGVAVQQLSLGVDVDVDGDEMVVAGAAEPGESTLNGGPGFAGSRAIPMGDLAATPVCSGPGGFFGDPDGLQDSDRPATSIAALPDGGYAVLYRDPVELALVVDGSRRTITLDGGEVTDVGHALFHESAGTGSTCAGCHPEGGEDGHTWAFETGARRSQTLLGGILGTAPFHWDGQVTDTTEVMDGTFVGRMGGSMPLPFEVQSFAEWMDELPALPGAYVADTDAVERGRALFERSDVGCTSCHSGDMRTNNQTVDVGTADDHRNGATRFQVPALYEVAYRPTYMHDGRASTLDEVLTTHAGGVQLDEAQRGDVAAYLRSL
ncbi:MAG: c-type cytochrome [Sandaracinaceae bacterium]